jgi:hypothetical protein
MTGLSHEQLMKLRSIVKDSGTGVQGHSRTPFENARALLHIAEHKKHGLSTDAAVKATAAAELASPSTLRAAADQFQTTGTLTAAEDGRTKPKHPFYRGEDGPSLAAQLLIHHRLQQVS